MGAATKIVLGTVQFGCQYGINSAGRPDSSMVKSMLRKASDAGINTLDTSSAYGDSEQVLGDCMTDNCGFRIVSKYPKCGGSVPDVFSASLKHLGVSRLYGYMLHHFEVFRDSPSVWDEFRRLRDSGLTERIGFSIYSPEELDILLEKNIDFTILQFPRNIFDRSFDSYLPELCSRGVEVHVRSTFLQGLFFKDRETLPEKLLPMRRYLLELDEFASVSGVTVNQLALNFNLQNPYVGGVLIGVDNDLQLESNLLAVKDIKSFPDIFVRERELLNPVNWK